MILRILTLTASIALAQTPPPLPPKPLTPAQIQALPWHRFWVSENRPDGLLVGRYRTRTYTIPALPSGGASTGNGNATILPPQTEEREERVDEFAWIPHTPSTKNLVNDTDFWARVQTTGTTRIDPSTVLPAYTLHLLTKTRPADLKKPKPPAKKPAPKK